MVGLDLVARVATDVVQNAQVTTRVGVEPGVGDFVDERGVQDEELAEGDAMGDCGAVEEREGGKVGREGNRGAGAIGGVASIGNDGSG